MARRLWLQEKGESVETLLMVLISEFKPDKTRLMKVDGYQ